MENIILCNNTENLFSETNTLFLLAIESDYDDGKEILDRIAKIEPSAACARTKTNQGALYQIGLAYQYMNNMIDDTAYCEWNYRLAKKSLLSVADYLVRGGAKPSSYIRGLLPDI